MQIILASLKQVRRLLVVLTLIGSCAALRAGQTESIDMTTLAQRIVAQTNLKGGVVVHIGCADGRLTAALRVNEHFVVQGLDAEAAHIEKARQFLQSEGVYGPVSVRQLRDSRLPYADHLVNLIVISMPNCPVSKDEIARVLTPRGAAITVRPSDRRLQLTVYSPPPAASLDDWTHFLYDASNNAVSHDRQVAPPKRLQWDGGPRWSRSHETDMSLTAAVSAGGRIFHTIDEGPIGVHETPRDTRRLPDKCSLVARDAFNGVVLWKRPIPDWGSAAWDANRWKWGKKDQLWSAPLTLPRRLIATADRLYVTLGFHACVSELDAATGKTLREFPETRAAEELVLSQNTLVVRVRKPAGGGELIMAIDVPSGNTIWKVPVAAISDLTLAVADGRVCFHDTKRLVALDLHTGKQLWQSEPQPKRKQATTAGTLAIADGVVLFAIPGSVEARQAEDGKLLWRAKTNTSFRGMPDLFIIDGLAWVGTMTTTGRDLRTGKIVQEIDVKALYTGGHHVRCYRGKATVDYLLWSKRGAEFVDLHGNGHSRNDWLRGTCRYGLMPANGLLYAPPHPCFCYPGVKLSGFNALAAGDLNPDADIEAADRLTKGSAYNDPLAAAKVASSADWPTYRHDNTRSGASLISVPTDLRRVWSASFKGKVSPPVLVDGRLFVSAVDSHRVVCLDSSNGKPLWSYTAGGPVDSPPTLYRGRVVFGCTDGCVYCLRAEDGELAWRFHAAPQDWQVVSYGRLESAWPVPGSVLIEDGIVYFVAGRSSYLDGGLSLFGLNVATGQVRYEKRMVGPEPDLTVPSNRAHEMDGGKNDILLSNGKHLFLTQNTFDMKWNPIESPMTAKWGARQTDLHLVATGGFLDDSGFDRLYWMYARRWPGLYVADKTSKAGQILVFDDTTTYGLHTFNTKFSRSPYFAPATDGYELFADANDNEPVLPPDAARHERGSMERIQPPKWSIRIPVRARAMVLTSESLFLAGPPDVIDAKDPYGAFEGRKGACLWAVSPNDGRKQAEYALPTPPVFDGLIAAENGLFITTTNGTVARWSHGEAN